MRALTIVHDLYPTNMDLRNYIRAFVAVQVGSSILCLFMVSLTQRAIAPFSTMLS
jgi:hypothetical protein